MPGVAAKLCGSSGPRPRRSLASIAALLVLLAAGDRVAQGAPPQGVDIAAPQDGVISGRLVDAGTGRGIARARVQLIHPKDDLIRYGGLTDEEGRFRIAASAGIWSILITPPDEYETFFDLEPSATQIPTVRLPAAAEEDVGPLNLRLRRCAVVTGHVVLPDGSPAPGATVYYPEDGFPLETLPWTQHVVAGPDGRFATPPLHALARSIFRFRANFGAFSTADDSPVDAREASPPPMTLRLARRPLAVVRGRVVDHLGRPVPFAVLNVSDRHPPNVNADPPFPRADAAGRFEIQLWPGVSYTVYAGADGYSYGQSTPLRPHPGVNSALPPIVLRRADSFLAFTVTDANGKPRPGAVR